MSINHQLALPPGCQLESYHIEKMLGNKGGFGITYLATDVQLQKRVAIKELLPDGIATRVGGRVVAQSQATEEDWAWSLTAFKKEAGILARFQHPNIVQVHRLLEANGTAYMVMEYLDGESYEEHLCRQQAPPSEEEAKSLLFQLLNGLEAVHQARLLHRDVKPGNIYLTNDRRVILLDFGAACPENRDRTAVISQLVVAQGYSPFEQYQSEARLGPWSDIYSTAATLARALTGEKPPSSIDRVSVDTWIPLERRLQGRYSPTFLRSLDAGLQLYARNRPQTVADWRSMFSGEASTTMPIPPPPPLPDPAVLVPPKRDRGTTMLVSAMVTCLVLALGLVAYVVIDSRKSPGIAELAHQLQSDTKPSGDMQKLLAEKDRQLATAEQQRQAAEAEASKLRQQASTVAANPTPTPPPVPPAPESPNPGSKKLTKTPPTSNPKDPTGRGPNSEDVPEATAAKPSAAMEESLRKLALAELFRDNGVEERFYAPQVTVNGGSENEEDRVLKRADFLKEEKDFDAKFSDSRWTSWMTKISSHDTQTDVAKMTQIYSFDRRRSDNLLVHGMFKRELIFQNASGSQPLISAVLIKARASGYRTRLSARDHLNANGVNLVKLTTDKKQSKRAALRRLLIQDRANFTRGLDYRDKEDEFFSRYADGPGSQSMSDVRDEDMTILPASDASEDAVLQPGAVVDVYPEETSLIVILVD